MPCRLCQDTPSPRSAVPAQRGSLFGEASPYVVVNRAEADAVQFAATGLSAESARRSGAAFSVRFRALADGKPALALGHIRLADADGQPIRTAAQ